MMMRRGRGFGQDFRGFVSAEGFNYGLSIYDGTHRRVILPPPHPLAPMPADSPAPRRPSPLSPASRAATVPAMYATRDSGTGMNPCAFIVKSDTISILQKPQDSI